MQTKSPGNTQRNLAQRLFVETAWAFAIKAISIISGLAVNAFLARLLPQDQMGAYFLLVSVAGYGAIVASFGLSQTVVRLVAESMAKGLRGRVGRALRIVYGITTVGVLVVGGLIYAGLGAWLAETVFEIPMLATVPGLLAVWIAVLAFQTPVAETFRGLHDIRMANFLSGAFANIILAVLLGMALVSGTNISFQQSVTLSLVSALSSLFCGAVLLVRRAGEFGGDGDIGPCQVIRISAPLFVINLAVQAYTNFSLWIVGAYLGAGDVAIFGAAWRLINFVALPLQMVNASIQPFIAELYATADKTRLQNALRGTATLAALPSLAVLMVLITAGQPILGLIYGDSYREGAVILAILSVGQIVKVLTGSTGKVLAFTGHQRQLMLMTLSTGVLGVFLMIYGVQQWGLVGVAVSTSAARILQNLAEWLLVRRLTGLWTHGTVSPSFIRQAANRLKARRS